MYLVCISFLFLPSSSFSFFSFPFLLTYTYIVPLARPYCFFFQRGGGCKGGGSRDATDHLPIAYKRRTFWGFPVSLSFPHFPHVARFSSLVPSQSTRRFCSFRRDCECFLSPLSGSSFSSHRERRSGSVVRELVKRASVFHFFLSIDDVLDCEPRRAKESKGVHAHISQKEKPCL